ncbi:MAG: DUF4127 family protein [Microbacteriaceae bacterium]|nr:DUF4127 family protein [Microbacteriaceae bacterium]
MTPAPRLALVPLDERPVNTGLVRDVAAIAGARLRLPPAELLPRFRTPGDVAGIAAWLHASASELDVAVVSIETLVHGGLIPSRTSDDTPSEVLGRLDILRDLRAMHPALRLAAVTVIMRASDSYSAVEEPDYWAWAGREVHALGGAVHRSWSGAQTPEPMLDDSIRADYARRRLRNHLVGLGALGLAWDGVFDPLIMTADDTATWSAGSAEQSIIGYWQQLRGGRQVLVYPGADETGAVLTARMLLDGTGDAPAVLVLPGDPSGMRLVPSYENVPLTDSIARQLAAVGAEAAEHPSEAELALVVHTPDPARGDHFGGDPVPDPAAIDATRRTVETALASGLPVALADLRYGNGGDMTLVESLAADGTLDRLEAYGGWNTAGNALGSTLASALAAVAGRRLGSFDEMARRRALRRRLVDDALYQGRIRRQRYASLFADRIEPVEPELVARAEEVLTVELRAAISELLPGEELAAVTLPWARGFEIDVRFEGENR